MEDARTPERRGAPALLWLAVFGAAILVFWIYRLFFGDTDCSAQPTHSSAPAIVGGFALGVLPIVLAGSSVYAVARWARVSGGDRVAAIIAAVILGVFALFAASIAGGGIGC